MIAQDERHIDDAWARSVLTEDVRLDHPVGSHRGLVGVAEASPRALAPYERTLHLGGNHRIVLDGDRASVRATLVATHVHPAGVLAARARGRGRCSGSVAGSTARRAGPPRAGGSPG